jgi:AraC-like DNA-binding protein
LNSIAEPPPFAAAEQPALPGSGAAWNLLQRRILCQDARGVIGTCEAAGSALNPSAASIFLIESGHLRVERDDGPSASFGAGAMLLCFGGRTLRASWERARFSHVQPSPQRLAQLLDGAPAGRGPGIEPLHHRGLAPFLVSQFDMLKRRGPMLAPTDLEHVFEGIFQTAEALLKGAVLLPAPTRSEPVSERLRAIHRFIERNLHRQDLSVSDVALGANISRASLYRLFATQAYSVHGTLREQRLQEGLRYLEQARSDRLSIGAIAHACGFSDQAVFSKLFRRRFGITPRQARSPTAAQEPHDAGGQFR